MAFRKAIGAKALDLLETALREIALIAARTHALDHHGLEFADGSQMPESRHGATQAIGLHFGKFRRDHGEAHRLFLEQWHAKRLAEHAMQFVGRPMLRRRRGKTDFLMTGAATQIGMHHVALDRPGPHDGDLDHEIIKLARAQMRQHVHLRAALDLEHADGIALAQHVIDRLVLARDIGQADLRALMAREQIKPLADAGEHAQRQDIDLHQAERRDVVLVPFEKGAVRHGGVADRRQSRRAGRA